MPHICPTPYPPTFILTPKSVSYTKNQQFQLEVNTYRDELPALRQEHMDQNKVV